VRQAPSFLDGHENHGYSKQSSLIIHPDEPYPCDGLDRSVKATVAANNDGVRNLTLRHFGALEKTRVFVAHQWFVFSWQSNHATVMQNTTRPTMTDVHTKHLPALQ
jgi:hypothetical protein